MGRQQPTKAIVHSWPVLREAAVPTPSSSVVAGVVPSTGVGTTSPLSVPFGALPSWQTFSGPTAFVYHPNVGVPEVYTRSTFRIR